MSNPQPAQNARVTSPTEAIAVLASTFALGILLHAASSSFCSGIYGHFKTLLLHRRRLVLLVFYLSAALFSLAQFLVLLLLGDVQCQIGVTLTTILEQSARISGLGIIVWKIYDESAYNLEKVGFQVALGIRGALGVVVIAFARTEFVPVCFVKPGIGALSVAQLIIDGSAVIYALVRIPLMFGLFKDQGQATTRSSKDTGKSQGYGLFLIALAYGVWWAGSFPHILGLGNLAIRVFPLVLALLLFINVLRLFPTLAFSVPATKSVGLRRLNTTIPPKSSGTNGARALGAISSPNGSPVLTPRPGDIESNKRMNNSSGATDNSVVFGNIIGAPSITKASTLKGGWALTKDQEGKASTVEKRATKLPVRGKSVISGPLSRPSLVSNPTVIPGAAMISGPTTSLKNSLPSGLPNGLPSGMRQMKTIDLKVAAEMERRRIDAESQRAEERRQQAQDQGSIDSRFTAPDVRTMDRTTSVKRKAVGTLGESSKESTLTVGLNRTSSKNTLGRLESATSTIEKTPNHNSSYTIPMVAEVKRITTAQSSDSLQIPPPRKAALSLDIPTAELLPEYQVNPNRSETVLFVNQIVYDDPELVKSLISPEYYMPIGYSASDGISLGLTTSRSIGSSAGLSRRSASRSPSRSPVNSLHVTKINDVPPRILTPIMMRKRSNVLSANTPRSLWPGSPSEEMKSKWVKTHRKAKSNPFDGPPTIPPPDMPLPPLPPRASNEIKAIKSAPLVRDGIERRKAEPQMVQAITPLKTPKRENNRQASTKEAEPKIIPHSETTDENRNHTNDDFFSSFPPPPVLPKLNQRLDGVKRMGSLKRTGSVKEQYAMDTRASGVSDEGYATAKAWIQNVRKANQGPSLVSIQKRSRSGTMDSVCTTSDFSNGSVSLSEIVTLGEDDANREKLEMLPADSTTLGPPTLSLHGSPELVQYDIDFDDDQGESEKTQSEPGDMVDSDEEDIRGAYSTSGEEYSIHDASDSGSDIVDDVMIESGFYINRHDDGLGIHESEQNLNQKLDDLLDEIIALSSPRPRQFKFGDQIPTFSESRRKYGTKRRPPPSPIGWLMQQKRAAVEKPRPQKIQARLTLLTTRRSGELDMEELINKFPGPKEKQRQSAITDGRNSLLESLEMEMKAQEKVWMDKKQEFRASTTSYLDEEDVSPMTQVHGSHNGRLSTTSRASSRLSQAFYAQRMRTVGTAANSNRGSEIVDSTATTSGSIALAGWQRQLAQVQLEYAEKRARLTVPVEDHLILKSQSSPTISLADSVDEMGQYPNFYHNANLDITYMTPTMVVQSPSTASSGVTEFELDSDEDGYEVEEIEEGRTPMEAFVGEYEYESASGSIGGYFEPLPATVYCPTPMMSELPSATSVTTSWFEEEEYLTSPVQFLWMKGVQINGRVSQRGMLWTVPVETVTYPSLMTPAALAVRPKTRKMVWESANIESQGLWVREDKTSLHMPVTVTGMWGTGMEKRIPIKSITPMHQQQSFLWMPKPKTQPPSLGIDTIVSSVPFIQAIESLRRRTPNNITQLPTVTSSRLWHLATASPVLRPTIWMPKPVVMLGLWPEGTLPRSVVPAGRILGLWPDAPTHEMEEEESQSRKAKNRRAYQELASVSGSLWTRYKNDAVPTNLVGLWSGVTHGAVVEINKHSSPLEKIKVWAKAKKAIEVDEKSAQVSLWERRGNQEAIALRNNLKLDLRIAEPRKTRKTLAVVGTPEHIITPNESMWVARETQEQPNWLERFRKMSLANEDVVNSTSITFVITSPASSIYTDDVASLGSSRYSEDVDSETEVIATNSSPILVNHDSYSPYNIYDGQILWDEEDVSRSGALDTSNTFYDSGSEAGSPFAFKFDILGPLKISNIKASLWRKQARQDFTHSCLLWCQYNQLSRSSFENIAIPTMRFQREPTLTRLEKISGSLWRKSDNTKPELWRSHRRTGLWSLNGETKTLYEITQEQESQFEAKLWTRTRAHRGTNLVADGYVIRRVASVGGITLAKVSGEMWRLSASKRPSLWQRPCWRLKNDIPRTHLWAKHTASKTTKVAPASQSVGWSRQERRRNLAPLAKVAGPLWSWALVNGAKPQLWQRPSWRLKQIIQTPLWAKQTNPQNSPTDLFSNTSYCPFRKFGSRSNSAPLSGLVSASLWAAPAPQQQHSKHYCRAGNYKASLHTLPTAAHVWLPAPIPENAVPEQQVSALEVVVGLIADNAMDTTPRKFVKPTGTPTISALALDSQNIVNPTTCISDAPPASNAFTLNSGECCFFTSPEFLAKTSPPSSSSSPQISIPRNSMAITQSLWQHTPEQRKPLAAEVNDTAISLWTKERASRTTNKRPERLNLKKFSSDKPVEKVYGPLWLPSATSENLIYSPTSSTSSEYTRATTPEIEEKPWLWYKISAPTISEVDDTIQQPFLWAKATASRTSSNSPISGAPRKFVSNAPLAQVSGSLWSKDTLPIAQLWTRPKFYWRLPEIAPKTPLWSRATASRTTTLAPQPLSKYEVRHGDAAVAVVSGSLWAMPSVDSALGHRSVDWLALSCRVVNACVASIPHSEVVLPLAILATSPPAKLTAKFEKNSGILLWSKETAERTTSLVPERIVDAKPKKIDIPLEKVTGRLWNSEDARSAKKLERVKLWTRPAEKWRKVTLEEIEKVKGAKLWIKETAMRTTDRVPERIDVGKFRPAEDVVVQFTGGLWAPPKEKPMLWQRQIKTVGSYGFPLQKSEMWQKETAKRSTKLVPERLALKPKVKLELELQKVAGPMWGVKSPARTHPRTLWNKTRPIEVLPTSSPLWTKEHASRTTTATPIRITPVVRNITEPLVKATGDLWSKNPTVIIEPTGLWKATMKPTGLWHNEGLTPTLSQMEEARRVGLWLQTPVQRFDIFVTDCSPLPAGKSTKSDNLPVATGYLWDRKIATTTISASTNGLWGAQVPDTRNRSNSFGSDMPSPSLSNVSTLDDDVSTISGFGFQTTEGNIPVEADCALIRSETNVSAAEGLWRRREAEVQAAAKAEAATSLWNTSIAAPIEREVRKNKVLVLEKPPAGGKKKKTLPNLTVKNLKELMIAEEGEQSPGGTSLWRRPSPMIERMFLALSTSRRAEKEAEAPHSPQTPQQAMEETSAPASPAAPKEEKHNPFSTMLRIPSLRRHLKPVTSPIHAHAPMHFSGPSMSDLHKPKRRISGGEGGDEMKKDGNAEEGRKEPPAMAMPGAEWLRRKGVVG